MWPTETPNNASFRSSCQTSAPYLHKHGRRLLTPGQQSRVPKTWDASGSTDTGGGINLLLMSGPEGLAHLFFHRWIPRIGDQDPDRRRAFTSEGGVTPTNELDALKPTCLHIRTKEMSIRYQTRAPKP